MHIEINSSQGKLYESEISELLLPTSDGQLLIDSKYDPIVFPLVKGQIIVKTEESQPKIFDINEGLAECKMDSIVILIKEIK